MDLIPHGGRYNKSIIEMLTQNQFKTLEDVSP